MARDVLQRDLDADGHRLKNLPVPAAAKDATYTDNETPPTPIGEKANPGKSRLAAPVDHAHASPAPMRIAASGKKTVIAAGATVTLAKFTRKDKELFAPGGFAWVRDDVAGVTWENEVSGAEDIATYHERTKNPDELLFKAKNESNKSRTIDWATVALMVA